MFFKNLTIFRFPTNLSGLFPTDTASELDGLDRLLAAQPLKPCGALELHSRGFVSPFGPGSDVMAHACGDFTWVTLGGEDKILPPAVVNAELAKRLKQAEEREGRSPGGRARKRLKEEVVHELLPRAFVKPGRCDAYFDFERGLLLVDTSTRKRAEQVVSEIRHAIGSFPALPVNAETTPRAVLTGWLSGDPLPAGLTLGEACVLEDPADDRARITVRNLDLHGEEITAHLSSGMQCTRLALVLDDHVSFEIDEDLTVRKLQFLDGAIDSLETAQREDIRAELDARFALMTGEVSRLFDLLQDAFQLTVPVDEDPSYAEQGEPRRKARGARDGISTVTVSSVGKDGVRESVTMSGQEFHDLPKAMANAGHVIADALGAPDPLYDRAVFEVKDSGKASISRLQRVMKIGYNRAARLLERMEAEGVVSPPSAEGDRHVIAKGALN